MEKGQKIAKESMSSEDIVRVEMSNWLVLCLIRRNPGITAEEIFRGLEKSLEAINKEKPNFSLMFAGHDEKYNYYVYSLDDLLIKYEMETLISVSENRKRYYITNFGAKILFDVIFYSSLVKIIALLVNGEEKC